MSTLFYKDGILEKNKKYINIKNFNEPLLWNTEIVRDMSYMFYGATSYY